jgi:DnaJ-class molecular chaperone
LTALAAEAPAPAMSAARLFEPSEVTLEESILGAWEALTARGRAECPVCHGELATSGCMTCGSQLA